MLNLKPMLKKGALLGAAYFACGAAAVWLASLASAAAGMWALLLAAGLWLPVSAAVFYRVAEPGGRKGWARSALTGFSAAAGAGAAGLALTGLALAARLSAGYPYGLDASKEDSLIAVFVALLFSVPTPLTGLLSGLARNSVAVSKDPAAGGQEGGELLGGAPAWVPALLPLLALLGGAAAVLADLLYRINKGVWNSPAWPWALILAACCCGTAGAFYGLVSARRSGAARELLGFSPVTLGAFSLAAGFMAAALVWRFPG